MIENSGEYGDSLITKPSQHFEFSPVALFAFRPEDAKYKNATKICSKYFDAFH